jgi:hypothetical protein
LEGKLQAVPRRRRLHSPLARTGFVLHKIKASGFIFNRREEVHLQPSLTPAIRAIGILAASMHAPGSRGAFFKRSTASADEDAVKPFIITPWP